MLVQGDLLVMVQLVMHRGSATKQFLFTLLALSDNVSLYNKRPPLCCMAWDESYADSFNVFVMRQLA